MATEPRWWSARGGWVTALLPPVGGEALFWNWAHDDGAREEFSGSPLVRAGRARPRRSTRNVGLPHAMRAKVLGKLSGCSTI